MVEWFKSSQPSKQLFDSTCRWFKSGQGLFFFFFFLSFLIFFFSPFKTFLETTNSEISTKYCPLSFFINSFLNHNKWVFVGHCGSLWFILGRFG